MRFWVGFGLGALATLGVGTALVQWFLYKWWQDT